MSEDISKTAITHPQDGPGVHLNPPVDYEGEQIDFISTDFSKLKGADLRQIAKEYKARFRPAADAVFFFDANYLLMMFGAINKIDPAWFDQLDGRSYLALTEFYKIGVAESLK